MANVIEFIIRARDDMSGTLGKINAQAEKFQSTLASKVSAAGFDDLGAAIGRIPLGLAAVGAAAGAVTAAGAAAVNAAKDYADLAIAFDQLAQKTGANVEFLSTMSAAAGDAEISAEAFSAAMVKFSDNLVRTVGPAANVQTELYALADAFAQMADGPQKTAMAIDAFGKAGATMIPLLNQGSAGLKAMQADMAAMGRVITEDGVRAANEFDDAMDKLSGSLEGLRNTIGAGVLPTINEFLGGVLAMQSGLTLVSRGLDETSKTGHVSAETFSQFGDVQQRIISVLSMVNPALAVLVQNTDLLAPSAKGAASGFIEMGRSAAIAAAQAKGSASMAMDAARILSSIPSVVAGVGGAGVNVRAALEAGKLKERQIADSRKAHAAYIEENRAQSALLTTQDRAAIKAAELTAGYRKMYDQQQSNIGANDRYGRSWDDLTTRVVSGGGGAAAAISQITDEMKALEDRTTSLKSALGQSTAEMDQGEQLQTAFAIATGELTVEQFEQTQAVKGLLAAVEQQKISNEQALTTVLAMREGLASSKDAFDVAGESGVKYKGEVDAVAGVVNGATAKVADLSAKIKSVPKDTKVDITAVVFGASEVQTLKGTIEDLHDRHITVTVTYRTNGAPPPGVGVGAGGAGSPNNTTDASDRTGRLNRGGTMLISTPINVNELNPRRAAMFIANAQRQAARAASLRARAGFG